MEKIIGIEKHAGKVRKYTDLRKWNRGHFSTFSSWDYQTELEFLCHLISTVGILDVSVITELSLGQPMLYVHIQEQNQWNYFKKWNMKILHPWI